MRRFEDIYVAVWCFVMQMTGTLLIPFIQGTIPAYMLALGSTAIVFLKIRSWNVPPIVVRYLISFSIFLALWLLLLGGSQLGLLLSDRRDFGLVYMVDPIDNTIVLRSTLFTQSLYLLCCVLIALYFRYFFQEKWMRYIFWSAYFLALYGLYEWLFFLVTHESGDFLVNRTFFGGHTASWSQTMSFGGIDLLRIKSTMLEPSVFAAAVIPYFFLALEHRKMVLASLLFFTAVFSTSTSCYIALVACLLIRSFWTGELRWVYLAVLVLVGIFLGSMALFYPDVFRDLFHDKLAGLNASGAGRLGDILSGLDLLSTYTVPNWIFGIGVGYAYLRVPDAILINCGLLGLGAFLWVFCRPVFLLPITPGYGGIRTALFGILVLFAISLTEFYIPSTWMFLGLAYYKLDEYRRNQRIQARSVAPTQRPPVKEEPTPGLT